MIKIKIETSFNGSVERTIDDGKEDCGWAELLYQFGYALRGLGYFLPEDFDEYIMIKEGQDNKLQNIFID